MDPILFSSARDKDSKRADGRGKDDWATPHPVLAPIRRFCDLNRLGGIGLDPCSNSLSVVAARTNWSIEPEPDFILKSLLKGGMYEWNVDSLLRPWGGHGIIYVNFPFSKAKTWAQKIFEEASAGEELIVMAAARTESEAWDLFWKSDRQCFWSPSAQRNGNGHERGRRRIQFIGGPHGATFPAALVYYGPRAESFTEVFKPYGHVTRAA